MGDSNTMTTKDLGFAQVPNIIRELTYGDPESPQRLSVYARELYREIKATAGDKGACWKSTRRLAAECGMSVGKVHQAKRELMQPMHQLNGNSLITVTKEQIRGDGGRPSDVIRVVNIWNTTPDKSSRVEVARKLPASSSSEPLPSSSHEESSSPDELNKREKNKRNRTTTNHVRPTSKPRNRVVVSFSEEKKTTPHSCLEGLALSTQEKIRFTQEFPDEFQIRDIAEACLEHGDAISNPYGWMKMAIRNGWKLRQSPATRKRLEEDAQNTKHQTIRSNRELADAVLAVLNDSQKQKLSVSDNCVTFNFGNGKSMPLGYLEPDFEQTFDSIMKRHVIGNAAEKSIVHC